MGFSMIQVIENIKREHHDFQAVNMRIGIHLVRNEYPASVSHPCICEV